MNLRSNVVIEVVKNNHAFRFEMPVGSSFIDCHEAALECAQTVQHLSAQAKEAEEKAAAEQPVDGTII